MTDLDTDYVFYCTGAMIANTYSANHYKLWLLDFDNNDKLAAWRAGGSIPEHECVRVNTSYTVTNPGPNHEVHVAASALLSLTTLDDMSRQLTLPARLAISATLWNKIPFEDRPLPPPNRNQDYRIKVVQRQDASGSIREYLGFHVKILGTEGSKSRVQFYSWIDDELGAPLVDLASSDFDRVDRGHSTIDRSSSVDEEGALFVSFDYIRASGFLVVPKVPYGAQTNNAVAVRRLAPARRRQPSSPMRVPPGAPPSTPPVQSSVARAQPDDPDDAVDTLSNGAGRNHHETGAPSSKQPGPARSR